MGFFLPLLPLLLISLSIANPHFTDAWGWQGHLMICRIAEQNLTANARQAVRDLLGDGGLAPRCSCADDGAVRASYPWTEPLHYANTQNVSYFNYTTDCPNDACVVGAIENYTWHLQNNYSRVPPPPGLDETLTFLAHFMGDVHQPLHVGLASDRGGNNITVYWLYPSARTNLHRVWDTEIIRKAVRDRYGDDLNNMTHSIVQKYVNGRVIDIREPEDYASESSRLARDFAYRNERNMTVRPSWTLNHKYFDTRLPTVEQRIAEAGWRLADLLNEIFSRDIESN